MKKLLLASIVLSSFSAFGAPSQDAICYSDFPGGSLNAHTLCRGVETESDKKAAFKCYNDAVKNITTNHRAALLCSGVKSDLETKVVMKCFSDSVGDGDVSAILCSGVKTLTEAKSIQKKYESVEANAEGSSILSSKTGRGAHLFLVANIRQLEAEKKELLLKIEKLEKTR